jgi:alpha-tubulin suppressor-like RCC1 family protein
MVRFTIWNRVGVRAATVFAVYVCANACTESTAPPRRFAVLDDVGSSDWRSVSVGSEHTCALKATGLAYCFGSNAYGQLGVVHSDTACGAANATYACDVQPVRVDGITNLVSISAGARHTCAISGDHQAFCWGANDAGQVWNFSGNTAVPMRIPGALGWSQISAGSTHTCAVRVDGSVWCWGANERGQLGDGTTAGGGDMVQAPLPEAAALVAAGESRTCARTVSGVVYCWGAIWTNSENGLEFTRAQLIPQLVPGAPPMAFLAVGSFTTCGADLTGAAYCWEGNPRGEMGTGTQTGSTTPVALSGGLAFVQLSAGIVQTCGVAVNGAGYCWGDDTFGELGILPTLLVETCGGPQLFCSKLPIAVFGRQHFTEISTGFGSHTCGVTVVGNLYCWGLGVSGQRGDGTAVNAVATPTLVKEPGG